MDSFDDSINVSSIETWPVSTKSEQIKKNKNGVDNPSKSFSPEPIA